MKPVPLLAGLILLHLTFSSLYDATIQLTIKKEEYVKCEKIAEHFILLCYLISFANKFILSALALAEEI